MPSSLYDLVIDCRDPVARPSRELPPEPLTRRAAGAISGRHSPV